MMKTLLLPLLIAMGIVAHAADAQSAPSKSKRHLFSPTPKSQLRPLSTDRPDRLESPNSVDAGHVQIEMDLVNWTYNRYNGVLSHTINIAAPSIRLGVTNSGAFQLVFDSWKWKRTKARQIVTQRGFGDIALRWKQNLWGNDGGVTAAALVPFVVVPLRASSFSRARPEAGIALPLGINLPRGYTLGIMTELDWLNGDADENHFASFNVLNLGYPIMEDLYGYVELTATLYPDGSPTESTLDAGLMLGVSDDVQFDMGCNLGLTHATPDMQTFVGVSYRR